MEYDFREVEKKWQAYWAKNKTFKPEEKSTKPSSTNQKNNPESIKIP